ncbi:hypothetical protein E5222_01015 [Alteraurantiacibacter aquimixticola]|uniref:DUF4129 domain-containing protein n=2 Tax=Alteraurantiacibacter aquimixticola TaxID=2489173 RepID=A0A4T3FAI2_9SPHN|nr:hypothetical protein E5222_01015 [Alteraurantiacibacter aquimixticola]
MAGDQDFARDWDAVRSDGDIQFAPIELPAQPEREPDWLSKFFEWLGELLSPAAQVFAGSWSWLSWVLIAAAVALILFAIYRIVDPAMLQRRKSAHEEDAEFVPERGAALALLEEADRLASEGRFDEATHLLLTRSVGQIAELRPDLIDPSSTAREISALPALPDSARTAFATIAERVERSLFALTRLSSDDWHAARAAYSEFALGYREIRT